MWKRLDALELDPPKDRDPNILSKVPLTNFCTKRETSGTVANAVASTGDKSPNPSKR